MNARSLSHRRLMSGVLAVLATLFIACAVSTQTHAGEDWAARQVVVKLVPGARIEFINQQYGTTELRWIVNRRLHLLEAPLEVREEELLDRLLRDRRVEWAELNLAQSSPEAGTQSFIVASTRQAYEVQPLWAHLEIAQAHQVATGRGVVVAVLDTGVDVHHPELLDRIVAGGFNYVDNDRNILDIGNGIDDNDNGAIDEMVGHGTFVSGLISAVAPEAIILPIKVLTDDGDGHAFQVAQGIYRAIEMRASVINMSLSAQSGSRIIAEAIEEASRLGIVVVAAAGNDGLNAVEFPASLPGVTGVASVASVDFKSPFTNYGPEISLSAPGEKIISLAPGGGYARANGTSVGAAIVSATAALIRSLDRTATADEIHFRLERTAIPIDWLNPGFEGQLGAGRIAPWRALRWLWTPVEAEEILHLLRLQ